jgi:hypothetical protein
VCDALGCNLEAYGLTALTEVHAETWVTYHLSEEDVKNGKNLELAIQKVTQKAIVTICVK